MAVTLKPEVLNAWPPHGWIFTTTLPDGTKWFAPQPLINTFRVQVGEIIKWRKNNPIIAGKLKLSTDWDTVANELIQQTVERLQRMHKGDHYLTSSEVVIDTQKKTSLWVAVKQVVDVAVNGERTLQDWLGDGGVPVSRELAESRSAICEDCPQNSKSHWSLFFTAPIAKGFAKLIEIKNEMKLHTPSDAKLGACKACDCCLPVKVWVPLTHIKCNMSKETEGKLADRCWVTKETL
jgi:hypothetical protein